VAIVFYTVLTFGSFRALRNRAYELFLLSHIVMVIFYLVGCWLHWAKFSYWVYVSARRDETVRPRPAKLTPSDFDTARTRDLGV
jgi:hypothetical protein